MSCVFCAIVAGEAPAIKIYEEDDYLAILDIRPFTRGHTLVIPKRHTVDLTDTPPDTVADLARIGQRIARAARQSGLAANGNAPMAKSTTYVRQRRGITRAGPTRLDLVCSIFSPAFLCHLSRSPSVVRFSVWSV